MTASSSWIGILPARLSKNARERMRCVEQMFDQCSTALYRYVSVRVGYDPSLVDDLMQQLWLKVTQSDRMIPREEFEYWLRRLAKNLITDHWRKVGRRPDHVPIENPNVAAELAGSIDREVLPQDILEKREIHDQLLLAITELRHEDQDLIIRHYVRGESFAEIAQAVNVSERAIEGRLYRARQQLRLKLSHLEE